jgi:glycosyltransferase involved in cell wall biosynthesis
MTSSSWLTVITVVKDAPDDFARTLDSISNQTLSGVEYLVIDSSLNRTAIPEAIAKYPAIETRYSWVEPAGIYPAMNSGLAQSTGDYVYFANAGDTFYTFDVLSKVHAAVTSTAPHWLFGDAEILELSGAKVITPRWNYADEKLVSFSRGHFPCHQATFVQRKILVDQGGFDNTYSIVADYAAFLKLTLIADPVYLDFVVATFSEGGISTTKWQESFSQFHRARKEILKPHGTAALREQLESSRRYAMVYLHREIRSKLKAAKP